MTSTGGGSPRVALYSHDAMGLGHVRRNLAVAAALAEEGASVLLIAGTPEVQSFSLPAGVDALVLPGIAKSSAGEYSARSLRMELEELTALRAGALHGALDALDPDLIVVDKLPLGVGRELDDALRALRRRGTARFVLGLRDVLDEPERIWREWTQTDFYDSVRELYDEIWVYGSRDVFDLVAEYGVPEDLAERIRFTGYLGRPAGRTRAAEPFSSEAAVPPGPLQLCVVGGGQDGFPLADAFCHARMPDGTSGVVVCGPFMPREERRALAASCARRDDITLLEFVRRPEKLLAAASNVVSMGGYNTVCELVALRTRALVVPRVEPRREQLIRAQRLSEMGILDMLHPGELTPAAVGEWLARSPHGRRASPPPDLDLDGLGTVQALTRELMASCVSATS